MIPITISSAILLIPAIPFVSSFFTLYIYIYVCVCVAPKWWTPVGGRGCPGFWKRQVQLLIPIINYCLRTAITTYYNK